MILRDIFILTKGTKVILAITFSVSVIAVLFAFFYYHAINRSEDPRIKAARKFLLKYEKEGETLNGIEAFPYLDSAFAVFSRLPDYKSSFETGVIYNNKGSAMLLKAIYDSTISEQEKTTLLRLSFSYNDSSISVYKKWIKEWSSLTEEEIQLKIKPFMRIDDEAFSGFNFEKILNRRIKNIILAQTETPRRLSVSLSNRGTIFRHLGEPDSAYTNYTKALLLWKENLAARSNLSVLMGGEPVKPTLIQSLFPPDKNKK